MNLLVILRSPFGNMNTKVKLYIIFRHNVVINMVFFMMQMGILFVLQTEASQDVAMESARTSSKNEKMKNSFGKTLGSIDKVYS